MRKALIILVTILCVASLSFGQSSSWGKKIQWGTTFVNTDSIVLRSAGYVDSLYASGGKDTLYSKAFLKAKPNRGVWGIAAWLEGVSGTSASIALDVRFGNKFLGSDNKDNIQWQQAWHNINSFKKDTLYQMPIHPANTAWYNVAHDIRQYRLWEADEDTVLPFISEYNR